ncbi:MAG: hypothetical protein O7B25_01980 [Gammaproteobacteria bacterium]|nr:hypothetical protein [Gammaproteobacteria bacterium]
MEKQAVRKNRRSSALSKPKPLSVDKLMSQADSLLRHEELSLDQQHQLLAVKRYLIYKPDAGSNEVQAALACAHIVIDHAQLSVYQRRYGLTPD